ncbi:MNIO family bufferin maturase [Chromobacterium sp. CV08]|uniref:MNIO family bufferin maturase n=1 Tax=Chromobacterium sp. CV08 TaxID=3133274 RepID=UPI003DA95B5B
MTLTTLPAACGIGLRAPHYREVLDTLPPLGWVEVHSENFFDGGTPLAMLRRIASHWPLSLHGVGLGLGSAARPDRGHLASLRRLIDEVNPASVSEHLSFNHSPHRYVNDLLPIPYTRAALDVVAGHVAETQDALGRTLLLENLSSYVEFPGNEMNEGEFLAELVRHTGCGILLDVNNLYVNRVNLGTDTDAVLSALPAGAIGEIHLAGYSEREGMLVDTHSQPVHDGVWRFYREVVERIGPRPTLIEWDLDIPPLAELRAEAAKAQAILESRDELA